ERPLREGEYRLTKILGVNKYEFRGSLAHARALLRITETARGLRRMDLRIDAREHFQLTNMDFAFDKPVTIDKSKSEDDLPNTSNTQLLFKPDGEFHSVTLIINIRGLTPSEEQTTQEVKFKLRL
ncbi:hypothetical protein PFISCL1PPCAC_11233, partial [Pristionchus fissidentatus]